MGHLRTPTIFTDIFSTQKQAHEAWVQARDCRIESLNRLRELEKLVTVQEQIMLNDVVACKIRLDTDGVVGCPIMLDGLLCRSDEFDLARSQYPEFFFHITSDNDS